MAISKQTPLTRGFPYMPLHNATILPYPKDRPQQPRVYILKSSPAEPYVAYGHSNYNVCASFNPETGQVTVMVGDKQTQRYSIKYPGRTRKQLFQRT